MTNDAPKMSASELEFLFEARDAVAFFEVLIANARANEQSALDSIPLMLGEAQKIQSLCLHVDRPLISLLIHRMANFLTDLDAPTKPHFDDLDIYIDILRGILDDEIKPDSDQAEFVRSLPVRHPQEIANFEFNHLEVLVIEPNRTAAYFVERELLTRGYRVSTVQKSFEALEIAVRTKPDMVISAALLDVMSGVDLARVMAVLPTTQDIPFAILTTFDANNSSLENLPDNVAMIQKGEEFGQHLTAALEILAEDEPCERQVG